MTNPGGGGAFHQYLKMEMSTGEYGTFTREVMLHVLSQIEAHVPESDQRETLAMLFGSPADVKLDYAGRRISRAAQRLGRKARLQGDVPLKDIGGSTSEGIPSP